MWYFKNVWFKWRYQDMTFKMKNFTETQKSSCIEDIHDDFKCITRKFIHDKVRLSLKDNKDEVLKQTTNIFGEREDLQHPIFTQNIIASISQNTLWEKTMILLFVVLEGVIFSQLLNFMIPREIRREVWWVSFPVGVILSLMIILAVKLAFNFYFEYLEAKSLQEEKNYPQSRMRLFINKRNLALLIFTVFLLFSIFAGFIRERVMLGDAAETNPFMGKMVFYMSFTLSIMVVLVLALIERALYDKRIKYDVYKAWVRTHKERKKYITSLKEILSKAERAISKNIEKYWSLVLDLQRIFRIRYDDEDEALFKEYQNKIATGDLTANEINDEVYRVFHPIQCSDELLFKYGVLSDSRIKKHLDELIEINKEIIAYEKSSINSRPNSLLESSTK